MPEMKSLTVSDKTYEVVDAAARNRLDNLSIPTKTSDLTNDSGYITEYTETDPTVPAWAKLASKPTYTASEVGAAPSSHTQAASTVTAGTFAGQVVANSSGQAYSTSLLRNCKLVSADTNPTVNGEICWTYK